MGNRLIDDTVYDFFKLAVALSNRRREAQRADDIAASCALGGAKIILVGMGHVMDPDQIRLGPPTDLLADTLGASYLPGGLSPVHVPERKWKELKSVSLLQRWLRL